MCSIRQIYKTALPTELKLENETRIKAKIKATVDTDALSDK
ncbi:MAG: hypothetical protein ACMUEM_01935 [Flavobacteriales bacterium AspAUS03]